ncbi:MAG: MarR family transcriptional regulator [Sphingomonadales bacterium]|nr:MarR family transcriptional regulator [Sphingomonadales bacterium]
MEQAIQGRSTTPAFSAGDVAGRDGADETAPWVAYTVRSSVLFAGSQVVREELIGIEGVRLSEAPLAEVADFMRVKSVIDILWLAAADAMEPDALAELCDLAAAKGCSLVCESSIEAIDRVAAAIPDNISAQLLVDADTVDRRIALAAARNEVRQVYHEVTRDAAMERIDRLQEEVARISRLLGELVGQRSGLPGTPIGYAVVVEGRDDSGGQVRAPERDFIAMPRSFAPEENGTDRQRAKAVRRLLRRRRIREQYFPSDLFADPAWDMLLDLYAARLENRPVSVSSLCIAAAVPATTALRWIRTMADAGFFVREADPQDGRRIFIALAESAFDAMSRYFEAAEE